MASEGDASQPLEDPQVEPPPTGGLGALWEERKRLRRRVKDENEPYATRWLNSKAIGVPSVKAMVMNAEALTDMAAWWCPSIPYAKTCGIELVRAEVGGQQQTIMPQLN